MHKTMKWVAICFTVFWKSAMTWQALASSANDGSGLNLGIAVDITGAFKATSQSDAEDAINIREAELSYGAPIDHIFDGQLSLAAHREDGFSVFELHEATISSTKLIPSSSFRIGQFFLGVGRLNRVHRHDWPFISAPKVFQEFFGEEGVIDSGGEYSYLIPVSFYLNATLGVTNGFVYGHAHDAGQKPRKPTHYGRLSTFFESTDSIATSLGANFLSRSSFEGIKLELVGLDMVSKVQARGFNVFMLQSEVWHRQLTPPKGAKDSAIGAYFYPQLGMSKNLFAGLRLDYYSLLSLKDSLGQDVANAVYGFVPTLIYKSSEFATFKLAYNHSIVTQKRKDTQKNQVIEVQSTFILGAHPAHEF